MSKLKVTKYLIYDSLENRWQAPVDSVSEKTDSVFLPSKSQDSLFFFIEKGISCEQNIPSYICGYELIRELFIFTKLILNSYLMYECLWEDLPLTKKLVSQLNQRTDDLHDWQTILVQNRQIFRIP